MKVIKRDGRAVDYDSERIRVAIGKANKEVAEGERVTKKQIENIIKYVEGLNKKRILVEDIQDIIETKLMELKKFELAKCYMIYRYNRALVRKSNTTDESILSLIKNDNKGLTGNSFNKTTIASSQRDYIAAQVSRDLTRRILLPEKISKAHEDGILYFHDADYFVHPIFNSSIINIGDMLDNGTVMNGKMIENPKSFQVACNIMTQIMATVASNQYGGESVDISHLGKYLRYTYDKFYKKIEKTHKDTIKKEEIEILVKERLKDELSSGIQTIQYQINTLMTTTGKAPFVTLFLNLKKDDPYIKENAMIIEEILNQRLEGIKNEEGNLVTAEFPKLVYVLDEHNNLSGGKYDYLTKLAIDCSLKRLYPDYISAKKMREYYEGSVFSPMGCHGFLSPWKDQKGKYKYEGRFNQGIVTINLPQIGILTKKDEESFFKLLDERLEICYEALMCRHHALLGTISDISPIHWRYGAIARLGKSEKIDRLLKGGYSCLSLGYLGIYETTKLIKGVSHTTKEGKEFALKLMNYLKDTVLRWKEETGIGFVLYGVTAENLCQRFANIDKEKYGNIKDVTDKGFYTSSYHVDKKEKMDVLNRLKFESEFESLSLGGSISYVDAPNTNQNKEELIKLIYDNTLYAEFDIDNGLIKECNDEITLRKEM